MKFNVEEIRALFAKATRGPVHLDAVDASDAFSGEKSYHVVAGGQTVAMVPEDLFAGVDGGDPWQAKREAELLIALRNAAEAMIREADAKRAMPEHYECGSCGYAPCMCDQQ